MKNILLIVVDTLRPDHLGCYGYGRATSPNLDRIASQGTILTSLWSASNFTAPAFTSLFTGLYPHHHGVFDFTAQAKSSPLAAVLESAGVRTGGVVAFRFFKNLLRNIWGDIEAVTDTRSFNFSKNLPFDVTDGAVEWLKTHGRGEAPFCLFVHYDGPHMPFRLPVGFTDTFTSAGREKANPAVQDQLFPQAEKLDDARNKSSMYKFMKDVNWGRKKLCPDTMQWIVDKYDTAVHYNDLAIGKLVGELGTLGLEKDTIVVILSDHGEEFLEHGGFAHGGIHLYEEIVRTVGIVHHPDFPGSGRLIPTPFSQVDILPALIRLAGSMDPASSFGNPDLVDSLRGGPDPGPEMPAVFCHGKSKVALRSGRFKLIVPRPNPSLGLATRLKMWANLLLQGKLGVEVFDLENDPGERINLARDKDLLRRLMAMLDAHLASPPPGLLRSGVVDEQERRRIEQEMRDLGYM